MQNLERVRVALWDVRAQWETGIRELTTTQSTLERWHASPQNTVEPSASALQESLDTLKGINATVRMLLEDIERALTHDD